jgi:hypothetical protein
MQIGLQLLDLAVWAMGEHADRAHTDHNLAGWWTLWQPRSQPPGEAPVNPDHPPIPAGHLFAASGYQECEDQPLLELISSVADSAVPVRPRIRPAHCTVWPTC